VAESTGYTVDDLHDIFMIQNGFFELVSWKGKARQLRWSSTTLDTKQFSQLMNSVEDFARRRKIQLRYPEQLGVVSK